MNLPSWKLSRILKSDLSKLSTLSEPFIVKFIENQSEHLLKLTLYHLKKRATKRSRPAREPSKILRLFLRGLNKKNSMLKKFVFKKILTIEITKSSKLHCHVNKVRKLYHARCKCNNKRDPKEINLKGRCQEAFAVLGQFCAKIITWDFNHNQNATTKLRRRYQTWKKSANFFKIQSFQFMPSVATGDGKQIQYLQIVFNN